MSFIVIVRAKPDKTLLGGVREHRSSRWGLKTDAEEFRQSTVEINEGSVQSSEIIESAGYPELFPHCAGAATQAINGFCEKCKKQLTVKDAKIFARFYKQWRAQGRKGEYRGKEKG